MDTSIQLYSLLASLLVLCSVVWLVRKGKLREEYSILWLFTAVVLLFLAIWRDSLIYISRIMGIKYGPISLFLIGMFFVFILLLHFSTVLTKLADQSRNMAQKIALLENEISEKKEENNDAEK